jgi:hypothetical protein
MFDALKKLFAPKEQQPSAPIQYEAQWRLSVQDDYVELIDDKGQKSGVHRKELAAVAIKTYDSGPATDDIWWVLISKDLQVACTYPQGADGEKAVLDWLLALPGFRHEEMIKAMGSTQNETFIVWSWD